MKLSTLLLHNIYLGELMSINNYLKRFYMTIIMDTLC